MNLKYKRLGVSIVAIDFLCNHTPRLRLFAFLPSALLKLLNSLYHATCLQGTGWLQQAEFKIGFEEKDGGRAITDVVFLFTKTIKVFLRVPYKTALTHYELELNHVTATSHHKSSQGC